MTSPIKTNSPTRFAQQESRMSPFNSPTHADGRILSYNFSTKYTNPDIKSSCGEQVDSRKVTAPYTVFGTSARPKTSNEARVPGPGAYQIPTAIGKAVLSTMPQAPACSLSGRDVYNSVLGPKSHGPGPGDYNCNPAKMGDSAPKYSLGKKLNPGSDNGKQKYPGPGAYEIASTVGRTLLSTQRSNPAPGFPRGERNTAAHSGSEIGPGQYSIVVSAVGKQNVSNLPSASSFSFGMEERGKKNGKASSGKYYEARSSVGRQCESIYKSSPGASMSGRTKFGSHF